jgi:phospholipid/cholesterol/gamma-HCH transport system substrate-binding protein
MAKVVHGANSTLAAARPLIAEARPFAASLDAAAPHLTGALRALPETTTGAAALFRRLPAIQAAASPLLSTATRDLPAIDRLVKTLGPDLQDAVPMLQYLAPRANTIAAWFSNTDALGQNGDAKGRWARFFVGFDPSTGFGLPGSPPGNSYTEPGDAARNAAYKPGDFPHLLPFKP